MARIKEIQLAGVDLIQRTSGGRITANKHLDDDRSSLLMDSSSPSTLDSVIVQRSSTPSSPTRLSIASVDAFNSFQDESQKRPITWMKLSEELSSLYWKQQARSCRLLENTRMKQKTKHEDMTTKVGGNGGCSQDGAMAWFNEGSFLYSLEKKAANNPAQQCWRTPVNELANEHSNMLYREASGRNGFNSERGHQDLLQNQEDIMEFNAAHIIEQIMRVSKLVPMECNGSSILPLGCPSIGSVLHHTGICKPCVFANKSSQSCRNGLRCYFCHHPHKERRKKKSQKRNNPFGVSSNRWSFAKVPLSLRNSFSPIDRHRNNSQRRYQTPNHPVDDHQSTRNNITPPVRSSRLTNVVPRSGEGDTRHGHSGRPVVSSSVKDYPIGQVGKWEDSGRLEKEEMKKGIYHRAVLSLPQHTAVEDENSSFNNLHDHWMLSSTSPSGTAYTGEGDDSGRLSNYELKTPEGALLTFLANAFPTENDSPRSDDNSRFFEKSNNGLGGNLGDRGITRTNELRANDNSSHQNINELISVILNGQKEVTASHSQQSLSAGGEGPPQNRDELFVWKLLNM